MIVCLCHGVTERQIEAHVDSGAPTVREVGRRCGAGTDCGMCRCDIRAIMKRKRATEAGSPVLVLSK